MARMDERRLIVGWREMDDSGRAWNPRVIVEEMYWATVVEWIVGMWC
jgi:hypothetical protein